ncbi:MAG: alanine racemase [bacterium]|nr:alanine racemase [bacterium]
MSSKSMPDLASGSTALLTIDLAAIGENYMRLCELAKGAQCASVVKADAYGLGAAHVVPVLYDLGCRTFFVATVREGIALRASHSDIRIYILDGLFKGTGPLFVEHELSPVLGSLAMLEHWAAFCALRDQKHPAALHLDTGMNRLGLGPGEIIDLVAHQSSILNEVNIDLVMSHLACADEPEHASNQKQLTQFLTHMNNLPAIPASLANSAGIFLGPSYALDLVRPGIALYGGQPNIDDTSAMRPVVTLTTHIAQLRTVEKGGSIGYGGAYVAKRHTRLATLPVGYADGYHRMLGSSNDRRGASTYIGGHEAPLLGRVSMDLITIDVTDIPAELAIVGAEVELLGAHVLIDDLAKIAGTIGYEILTSLGARYERHYTGEK